MGNRKKRRKKKSKHFHSSVSRASYNMVLYEARQKAGLGRLKFARKLGIFPLLYPMFEYGYFKPSARHIAKISAYLGEDYQPYMEGISSYPQELPEKKSSKLALWFWNLLGSTPFRLFFVLLIIACLGFVAYSVRESQELQEKETSFYPEELHQLRQAIIDRGTLTLYYDPDSLLEMDLFYMEVVKKEGDKLISIKTDREPGAYTQVEFLVRLWSDKGRANLHRTLSGEDTAIFLSYTEYETNLVFESEAILNGNGDYEFDDFLYNFFMDPDPEMAEELTEIFTPLLENFDKDIDTLIREKLDLSLDSYALAANTVEGERLRFNASTHYTLMGLIGFAFGLVVLFCLIYALLYGTKKGVDRRIATNNNLIRFARRAEPATDFRITPFLPETLLCLLGSYLLYRSSSRFILLAFSFSFSSFLDINSALVQNQSLTQLFYVSMFLLYFLDFDTFLDDRRVQGKIALYFLCFVALHVVETGLITFFAESPSLVYQQFAQIKFPNMFGSICCYFIIMHFLFFTPKRVNTRKKLRIYRLCSLLPVLLIFGSKIIFNGGEKFFGWNLPIWLKYMFNGERITFSLLCVGYLFGLFFLRLFFEKRYGTENARKYFNGNRFLWQKNILTCLLVCVIALISYLFRNNPVASTLGLGEFKELLILLPLLLFYHPHKGPRNRLVDAFTMGVYLLALCYGYVVGGIILLLGFLTT